MGVKSLLIIRFSAFFVEIIIPLNKGQHCPIAPITPRPVNCPIESSINSSGIPQINKVMKYGNRKTPRRWKIFTIYHNLKLVGQGNVRLWNWSIVWRLSHLHRFCTWCRESAKHSKAPLSSQCKQERTAFCSTSAGVEAWDCCHLHRQINRNCRSQKDLQVA